MTLSRQQADDLIHFFGLPLAEQMRAAAVVLEDASRRHYKEMAAKVDGIDWRPVNLRYVADGWEAEEQEEEAKKEAQVTELAELLYASGSTGHLNSFDIQTQGVRERWITAAKAVIDAGWTKS